jgi:hypothetical protein
MMLTRSALKIDPLRFPFLFLYVFSSALDMSLIFPLFDPTSSSSALAPLYFSMVTALFVVVVNNLSTAGSFVVPRLRLFSWLLFLWSSAGCVCGIVLLFLVGVLYCVGFSSRRAGPKKKKPKTDRK